MKRPRPHVPIPVRREVLLRQLSWASRLVFAHEDLYAHLCRVLNTAKLHLDHDPPLRARTFNPRTRKYTPDANDPRFLIYRTPEDHKRKTNLRGDGAQYPDRVLIKRERRRQKREIEAREKNGRKTGRKSAGPKRKHKWPSRPFPKKWKPPETKDRPF